MSAWGVAYEWDAADTAFDSSDPMLNKVWKLCENTLRYGVLDTFTDSNTRERRPYEADGLITGSARGMVQRDVMWGRHSYAYIIQWPTWPIEWQQQTPILAWSDYMATGKTDLSIAYFDRLLNNTKANFIDETGTVGLVNSTMHFGLSPG